MLRGNSWWKYRLKTISWVSEDIMWKKYSSKWSHVLSLSLSLTVVPQTVWSTLLLVTVVADTMYTEGGLHILLEITEGLQSTQTRRKERRIQLFRSYFFSSTSPECTSLRNVDESKGVCTSVHMSLLICFGFIFLPHSIFILSLSLSLSLQPCSNCQSRKNEQRD